MDYQTMEQAIHDAIANCDADAQGIAARSQEAARQTMRPGQRVPQFKPYDVADERGAAAMKERVSTCYRDVCKIIDAAKGDAGRRMSAPATADEVATVQFALAREGITGEELAALHDRYGGNYQLARAIEEKAAQVGSPLATSSTATADADAAKEKAARILSRYMRSNVTGADILAADIAAAYRHVDALGRPY